jgi:hypothetical protein
MRAMSILRFIIFGAVGFGIGGAVGGLIPFLVLGGVGVLLGLLVGGAVGGAALGLALKNFRRAAGAVGFSVGNLPADFIRFPIPIIRQLGETGSIAITGIIGGASLGAAPGYLEHRKLAEERRLRGR